MYRYSWIFNWLLVLEEFTGWSLGYNIVVCMIMVEVWLTNNGGHLSVK